MNAGKQTHWLWIASSLSVLFAVGIYLRAIAVPVRQFSDTSWFFHERQRPTVVKVEVDPQIDRAIRRAQRDYMIAPAIGGSRWLHFNFAFTVEPNDLYLVFGNGVTHLFIVYRCGHESGELFWKAIEFQDF